MLPRLQRDPGGQEKGTIQRYDVRRGMLQEYWMNNGAGVDFLEAKHPTAKNITRNVGEACRDLLVPASFVDHAVQISGMGHFAALPGVYTRNLAVLRLETFSGCKLVPRR